MRERFRSITSRSMMTAGVSSCDTSIKKSFLASAKEATQRLRVRPSRLCAFARKALRHDLERSFLLRRFSRHHVFRFDQRLVTPRRKRRKLYELSKIQV